MNHLLRRLAPITDDAWDLLDDEARERATAALSARRLVDFSGPHGWRHSATDLGRTRPVAKAPERGIEAVQRQVLPLVELRAGFDVSRAELQDHTRGAVDVDLADLDDAARRIAVAENAAVFHGWEQAGMAGITDVSPHERLPFGTSADDVPGSVAGAVELLLQSGVSGPYGLALGPEEYTQVLEATEHGGYPLRDHLAKVVDGPIVWTPGLSGAVVLSLRGDDFLYESGQDLSLGYAGHDADAVHLYLGESFSFRVATPEAAVALSR
ncbi:MAG: bacteriocin family protein [Actinomycetota bacterium]|nr:bacteriocin family protein [Actinomycetota bacterium]